MYLRGLEYHDEPFYDFIKYKLDKIAKETTLSGMSQEICVNLGVAAPP